MGTVGLFCIILVIAGNKMLDLNGTFIYLKFSYQLLNSKMELYSLFQGGPVSSIA